MADVFISYSRADARIAEELADRLRTAGIDVFYDSEVLVPGESFSETISQEVNQAGVVVLLLSKHSRRSSWVEHELAHTLEQSKFVIPVRLDSSADENWIWPLVASRHSVELRGQADLQRVTKEIARAVAAARHDVATPTLTRSKVGIWLAVCMGLCAILVALLLRRSPATPFQSTEVKQIPIPIEDGDLGIFAMEYCMVETTGRLTYCTDYSKESCDEKYRALSPGRFKETHRCSARPKAIWCYARTDAELKSKSVLCYIDHEMCEIGRSAPGAAASVSIACEKQPR